MCSGIIVCHFILEGRYSSRFPFSDYFRCIFRPLLLKDKTLAILLISLKIHWIIMRCIVTVFVFIGGMFARWKLAVQLLFS